MAKTQKNLQLAEEVLAWLQDEEKRTGATQTRIVLAGILSYFCKDEAQRLDWMELAVEVDRGEAGFWDIPARVIQNHIDALKSDTVSVRASDFQSKLSMLEHRRDWNILQSKRRHPVPNNYQG